MSPLLALTSASMAPAGKAPRRNSCSSLALGGTGKWQELVEGATVRDKAALLFSPAQWAEVLPARSWKNGSCKCVWAGLLYPRGSCSPILEGLGSTGALAAALPAQAASCGFQALEGCWDMEFSFLSWLFWLLQEPTKAQCLPNGLLLTWLSQTYKPPVWGAAHSLAMPLPAQSFPLIHRDISIWA